MQKVLFFAICLLVCGPSFAQNVGNPKKPMTPAEKKAADLRKNAISGFIRTARNVPVDGAQAFIYAKDSASTIMASGYSDATGYYETNSVFPGTYNIKLIYPSSNKTIMIPDVVMKKGLIDITLKMDAPSADTTIQFLVFQPKPPVKGKAKTN